MCFWTLAACHIGAEINPGQSIIQLPTFAYIQARLRWLQSLDVFRLAVDVTETAIIDRIEVHPEMFGL